ncbi:MAG: selenide, water dikinase SelD, partial [Zoogloea sp.]|nr:selenide, water dikinase SelD [Zoogloea sp.]
VEEWQRSLTADAQTSGGLLVACDAGSVEQVLACFRAGGFDAAAAVGRMHRGEAQVRVCA